jgi:hypothetical protein
MSGHYVLDTPEEYNDSEYCPDCAKAIIDALKLIPKKTEMRYVDNNDYTFDELMEFEEAKRNTSTSGFPQGRRVFARMVNFDNPNDPVNFHRTEHIDIKGTDYIYRYSTKTKELISLRKNVRWDLINNRIYK